jgi:hypothetical protein
MPPETSPSERSERAMLDAEPTRPEPMAIRGALQAMRDDSSQPSETIDASLNRPRREASPDGRMRRSFSLASTYSEHQAAQPARRPGRRKGRDRLEVSRIRSAHRAVC